jgi:hypothetical protein
MGDEKVADNEENRDSRPLDGDRALKKGRARYYDRQ